MDRLNDYRKIIKDVLVSHTRIPYSYGNIHNKVIADDAVGSYLLLTMGWHDDRRVHGVLIHLELVDGKIWIQRDGTEYGVARELEAAGIPKTEIVLGFKEPAVRPYTEYAVA